MIVDCAGSPETLRDGELFAWHADRVGPADLRLRIRLTALKNSINAEVSSSRLIVTCGIFQLEHIADSLWLLNDTYRELMQNTALSKFMQRVLQFSNFVNEVSSCSEIRNT